MESLSTQAAFEMRQTSATLTAYARAHRSHFYTLLLLSWKPRIHSAPLTREPGRAVALGRVLVLT
jgi:hypothetical protein